MALIQASNKKQMYSSGLLVIWLLAVSATALHADIYKYVDESGVMHFTNVPTSERYELFIKGNTEPPADASSDSSSVSSSDASSASLGAPSPSLSSISDYSDIKNFYGTDAYDDYISIASQSYGVPFCLVKSIIKAESNFDCRAISVKGAQGLMQLMPGTAKLMNVSDPFDPYQNIMGGTRYFRMLLNQFNGKVKLALAGYNAGPKNVEKHKGIPPFKETRGYIGRVVKFYRQLKWKEILLEEQAREALQKENISDNPVDIQPIRLQGGLTQLIRQH